MAVTELRKPMYMPCSNCSSSGCTIHGSHPETCKGWQCLWAAGLLGDAHRPDRSGLIFDQTIIDGVPVVSIHEVVPGALDARDRVAFLIAKIRESGLRADEIHEWPFGTRGTTQFAPDQAAYPGAAGEPIARVHRGNSWYRMTPARKLSA